MYFYLILMTCTLLWGVYFWQFTENWFGPKFKYLFEENVRYNKKFRAYTRNDRVHWNKVYFFIIGFLTLPTRIFLIVLIIVLQYLIGKTAQFFLGLKNIENQQEQNQAKFDRIFRITMQFNTRLILFICGFFWNPVKKIKFDQQKFQKIKPSKDSRAQIIISNHTNPMDPFVICYLFGGSFVSKESVKSYPLVGPIAQFNKSVFLNRSSKENRQKVFDDIKQKIAEVKQNIQTPQLTIFPEGGTTNGKGIIDFRKGAFTHSSSLQIVGLKYTGSQFSLGFTLLGTLDFAIGMLCNTQNKVSIQILDTPIERSDNNISDEEYMAEVKKLMCQEMGFENISGYFYERGQFENPYIGEFCE